MRSVKLCGALATLAGLLTGCPAASDSADARQTPAVAAPPAAGALPLTAAGYHTWRGQWPEAPDSLTLHLIQPGTAAGAAAAANAVASYTLSGAGRSRYLYLLRVTPDTLLLEEGVDAQSGGSGSPAVVWALVRRGAHLAGTRAGRAVVLRAGHPPGSVPLAVHAFADSVLADARLAASARGHLCLVAVLPPHPARLTAAVRSFIAGDTVPGTAPPPTLPVQWAARQREFQQAYRADVDTAQRLAGDSAATATTLNYAQQTLLRVIWNEAGLLSLGAYAYSYRGGAHGYHATTVASFDPLTGRRLGFDDVFRPGAAAHLGRALDRAARRQFALAPPAPLGGEAGAGGAGQETGPLFVAHIPVTRNMCLTGGGVLFVYHPYEIAAYAYGELELFVPFSELRAVLRPGLPGVGGPL